MSGLLSLSAKIETDKSKVSISPINNINVNVGKEHVNTPSDKGGETLNPYDEVLTRNLKVKYQDDIDDKLHAYENAITALKLIIIMMKENPIYVNNLIVVDDVKLAELVKLMTNADEVTIDAEDIGCSCFAQTYRKVIAIYVIKDGNTKNLKYDFPNITKDLKELGINIKVVW
mgnify:CR=1 FL=1